MAELQFTLTGEATPFLSSGPLTPFTASFDVNTLTGTQDVQFAGGVLVGFESSNTQFTNVQLQVGGNLLLNLPTVTGGIFGMEDSQTSSQITMDGSVGVNSVPSLGFGWLIGGPLIPQGTPDPIGAFLMSSSFGEINGGLDGVWNLQAFSVKVTDITTSVLEPGISGLFALGAVALICAHRSRRRKLAPESIFRNVARTLHGPSIAAVLALVTGVTLGASSAAKAAIMEVDAIGTIDYYHYTTLERTVVTPTVSYFDTLGSEVPSPLFDGGGQGNGIFYNPNDGSFDQLNFAVAGFAVNQSLFDWMGIKTANISNGTGNQAYLNFNRISQAEFSSLQDPWAAVFNGATFFVVGTNEVVFYDGVSSTIGDPGLLPDGISISINGSIHEVPEPPLAVLMALGLVALWAHRDRSRKLAPQA
jgi:hypothetical protein